jgi:hypothetical protein
MFKSIVNNLLLNPQGDANQIVAVILPHPRLPAGQTHLPDWSGGFAKNAFYKICFLLATIWIAPPKVAM